MKPLVVPKKYQRTGLKVYCSKCNRQVSKTCGGTKKSINSCKFPNKHSFKAVVHIPMSDYKRRTRLLQSRDAEEAVNEMAIFKKELKETDYQPSHKIRNTRSENLLVELCKDYIDFIEGVNTPEHLKRNRNEQHKKEIVRVLLRFNTSLKKKGYNLETLRINRVNDDEVGVFHSYLIQDLSLGRATYNRHIIVLRGFYKWLKAHKSIALTDPFAKIELIKPKTVPKIITNKEFKELISIVTKRNGVAEGSKRRNYYKPYLPVAFRLALETGCRREELAQLKWSDILLLEKEVEVIKIQNLKVNRIQSGNDEGEYQRYIPMTSSLKEVLTSIGYEAMKGCNSFIIDRPKEMNTTYFMESLSRGFAHYIKQVSDRGLHFKDLRKTYITRITEELGASAKVFTGHTNDEVLKGHYIASEYTAAKLNELDLFNSFN